MKENFKPTFKCIVKYHEIVGVVKMLKNRSNKEFQKASLNVIFEEQFFFQIILI